MAGRLLPIQQASLDAYNAACALVPRSLRNTVILFGGAASLAHGFSDRRAVDVDILVGVEALVILYDAIVNMRAGFHRDYDETIKWDKCDLKGQKLFEVTVKIVEFGGPFGPQTVPQVVRFGEGYVATLPELVRLQAATLVNRGDESDYTDFYLLLSLAVRRRAKLPLLEEEELGLMKEAVDMCQEFQDANELLMSILGSFNKRGV